MIRIHHLKIPEVTFFQFENSLKNFVPIAKPPELGDSMTTSNRLTNDDDFIGKFDEDGSYIGDEQTQAIQHS